ncbi:hypothetical protein [Thermomonospora umbrina]|uniref:Uncharacterized protein n=1 Tax=Thermomonospora umbrina TaxID=111806 RepID=A0A3D9T7R5_9ACTN|nr:hypothetical protein [Thermomonospora umbrina]REF00715.1 hypothetical protein DFJ69_6285 [Thermomonospora umbrina]
MSDLVSTGRGLVPVSYHRFILEELDERGTGASILAPDIPVRFGNGLITVEPGLCVISTGIAGGPVTAEVRVHTRHPDIDGGDWDEIVELTVETTHDRMVVAALGADLPAPLPLLTPSGAGTHRVRAYARGRDSAIDASVFEPVESYLIQIWPAPPSPETIHRNTDSYGKAVRRSASLYD